MPKHILKALIFVLFPILASCKVAVIVVEGGNVQSLSMTRNCPEGEICLFEVSDTSFFEAFTVVAKPGWRFVRWNSGGNFICANSTSQVCVVDAQSGAGVPLVEALIASDTTAYLMPVFEFVGEPITDTIFADGREWAQVILPFGDLEWAEIDAVCPTPGGVCTDGLNGVDLRGWTWASVDEVNSLFNYYIGSAAMGPGPDFHVGPFLSFSAALDADGWVGQADPIIIGPLGYTRDAPPASCSGIGVHQNLGRDEAASGGFSSPFTDCVGRTSGGWFYRSSIFPAPPQ